MAAVLSTMIQVHLALIQPGTNEPLYLALKRSAGRRYPSMWQVITGSIDEGETARDAALREVLEESSLRPVEMWSIPHVATYFWEPDDAVILAPVFGMLVDPAALVQLSHEHEHFEWLSYEESLERLVMPSHKEGTRYFHRILGGENRDIFRIKLPE